MSADVRSHVVNELHRHAAVEFTISCYRARAFIKLVRGSTTQHVSMDQVYKCMDTDRCCSVVLATYANNSSDIRTSPFNCDQIRVALTSSKRPNDRTSVVRRETFDIYISCLATGAGGHEPWTHAVSEWTGVTL